MSATASAVRRAGARASTRTFARRALARAHGHAAALAACGSVAVLVALEVVAIGNRYAMRVTADTPTFMALIRDLAVHPLRPDSVFFGTVDTHSIHASPYLQALALIWKAVAPAGHLSDPMLLGTFLAVVTIVVTVFVLAMLWLYVRELAGRTAAFAAIPALLALFGPVHIAFPSDLTLNGFLSTGYFPTTFATGLTLATLVVLRRRSWNWTLAAAALTAVTLTTDPLNGAVLTVLMIASACLRAPSDVNEAFRIPLILTLGFLLAGQWPAFDIMRAFASSGLPVPKLLAVAIVAPLGCRLLTTRLPGVVRAVGRGMSVRISARTELRVAQFGAWAAAMLLILGYAALTQWPLDHPVLQAYRLGFYWNDERDRWLLLLLPGACGLIGLLRLARRGGPEQLVWFAGFFVAGFVGAVVHLATGYQLPFYYRFILLCQIPVAVGAAAFLAHHKSGRAALILALTVSAAFAFKTVTLLTVPTDMNYFGARLPSVWTMGSAIPPASGRVASDPNTSYFIPIAAQDPVVTLGPGHADSGAEPQRADTGYALMRDVYLGPPAHAAAALGQLWRLGTRWVVVEKFTTFRPPDLRHLFLAPYNALIDAPDVPLLATYEARLAMVGRQVYDDGEFVVFRLIHTALSGVLAARPSIAKRSHGLVLARLRELSHAGEARAAGIAPILYRLGVRIVALSSGALGSTPRLIALGRSMTSADVVSFSVDNGRWRVPCPGICASIPDTSAVRVLGRVIHDDPRFTTIVALRPPRAHAR